MKERPILFNGDMSERSWPGRRRRRGEFPPKHNNTHYFAPTAIPVTVCG